MVVRTLSSSLIEEAIPSHFNKASHLAPQEIYRPKKVPELGKTEMSKTDRNRIRRQMKHARKSQHLQKEERTRILARLDPRKQSALDKREAIKSLSKNKNVTIMSKVIKKKNKSQN